MAYEISEGAAAAALLLPNVELNKLKGTSEAEYNYLETAMGLIYDNLDNVVMSDPERRQYKAWFDVTRLDEEIANKNRDAKLTAVIHGYSAAKGIKEWFKVSQTAGGGGEKDDNVAKNDVFVTGAGWDDRISFLKMSVGDWDDYNSSDLVVIKNKCYYGISLKKKKKDSSADPPMINKSVKALLEELGQEELAKEFYGARGDYFGGQVRDQVTKVGGAFKGSKLGSKTNTDLFATTIKHPIKSQTEWVNLMDIKGEGKLNLNGGIKYEWSAANKGGFILDSNGKPIEAATKQEFKEHKDVLKLFGYTDKGGLKSSSMWKMRKAMNSNLRNNSPLYKKLEGICKNKDMASKIGQKLVNAVMKTELNQQFKEKGEQYKDRHFGFALVTAHGEVKGGRITAPAFTASFKSDPTMQQVVANMFSAVERDNFIITIDKKKTDAANEKTEPPAKLFFVIGVGKYPIPPDKQLLELDVRYKGSFSPSPQFLGGLTKAYARKLKSLKHREQYEFGKACDAL
jgi:hypothetical protein